MNNFITKNTKIFLRFIKNSI